MLNANDLHTERQALCTWTPASLRSAASLRTCFCLISRHWLRHSGLKTARAWRLKERLRDILAWRRYPQVPVLLLMDGWIRWARRCRLPAFKRLGKTFQTHLEGIRNMLAHANSNAAAESINADIQGAIARARGFRTFRNLRTIVYLLKARLDLPVSPFQQAIT